MPVTITDAFAGSILVSRKAVRLVTQRNPSGPQVTSQGLLRRLARTRFVKCSGPV